MANTNDRYLTELQRVALGARAGLDIHTKFGRNPSVAPPEDIWHGGGTYTGHPDHDADPETLTISSANAADTAAGTGIRTLRLEGLDADWAGQSDVVTLDGTTPVTTTTTWHRMYRAYGVTAGSALSNVGDITVRHTTTTSNVFAVIPAGFGQTQIAAYTLPAHSRGLVVRVKVGVSNSQVSTQEAQTSLVTRDPGGPWRVREPVIVSTVASAEERPLGGFVVGPRTDMKLRVLDATANNLAAVGRFDIVYVTD